MEPPPNPKNSPLGPQKVKNDPKIKLKSKVRIEETIENKSYSTTWVDPKTVLKLYLNPKNSSVGPKKIKNDSKNSLLGLQKVKNCPKIKSNSKVRIEEIIENKSCLTTLVDSKTVFEPYRNPINSPLGPPKSQKWPKN